MDRVVAACRRAHAWRSSHQFLGRYSVDKLQQFHQYQRETSGGRSFAVVALAPALPLAVLIVLSAIDSHHRDSVAVSVQSALAHALGGVTMALSSRQALCISRGESPLSATLFIGAFVGVGSELVRLLLMEIWQTTHVPMSELLVGTAMFALYVAASYGLMRQSLRRRRLKARTYAVVFALQGTIVSAFALVALAFTTATYAWQLLLILAHPALRVAANKLVWLQARKLNDLTTDVTICLAEMAGTLCQAACLLRVRAPELGVLLVLTDLSLVSLDLYVYVSREYVVDGASTLHTSAKIIEGALDKWAEPSTVEEELAKGDAVTTLHHRRRDVATDADNASAQSSAPLMTATATATSKMPHTGSSSSEGDPLFRKSGVAVLAKATAPPMEPAPAQNLRRSASDSLSGDAAAAQDGRIAMESTTRGDKTGRARLTPMERRAGWVKALAAHSRRASSGGSTGSIFVSSSAVILSTTSSAVAAAAAAGSSAPEPRPHRPGAIDSSRQAAADSKVRAVGPAHSAKRQRRSLAHAAVYATQPSESDDAAAAPSAASATSPGEAVRGRARRRASSVFLTPRLFQDHGAKRLMDLSAAPVMGAVAKPAGPAVRSALTASPSQVKIDGLGVRRKDQARILEQTLQLMFSLEALVVVQFVHVLVPVVIGLALLVLWFLPSYRTNALLCDRSSAQTAAMASAALAFGALEAVPLALLCRATERRYGLPATRLLSFVLEHYWMSFLGKLVGVFVAAFLFLSQHYGVASTLIGDM